ncbi:MAG: ATP-binding protein, partial [Actinoallomurus sp.]
MTVCPPPGALVGRDAELDRLDRLVREAAGGVGGSVWIEGEPGIGKSALLRAALADAARLGCEVRSADADEFGCRIPLQVMLECVGAEPGSGEPELREIAESLSRGAGRETPGDPVAAASERLLGLVDGLTRRAPLVLAVDDLQWADEASVLLLHRLSRVAHRRPLLLIVACRPVPRRPDLVTLRRGLTASGAGPVTLSALTPAAVIRLTSELTVRLTGARTTGPRLRRSIEHAGGNPLYLRELIDALVREDLLRRDEDTVELAGDDRTGLPRRLTDAIAERLDFLSAGTVEILRSAALLGSAFSVTDLGAVVGRSAIELTSALDEATAAGVLAESELFLTFRHTLIRQALYERPAAGLRLALHLQAARTLADAGMSVERVAEQLLAALRAPEAGAAVDGWTIDWLLGAGRALVSRAPGDAVELLGLTDGQLRPDDPRREPLEA